MTTQISICLIVDSESVIKECLFWLLMFYGIVKIIENEKCF
jgi:hypothetical protein